MWTPKLNAVLGSLVVTLGFWMLWGEAPVVFLVAVALATAGFLAWRGGTVAVVWTWATLLLVLESIAWPIVTMVRVRLVSAEPNEQQMGDILTSVLFGLFSGIFWMTFAWGIYKRMERKEEEARTSGKLTK
jgi:hypothetical protein